jgi:peptide/nickel transport system ATP-binding protein
VTSALVVEDLRVEGPAGPIVHRMDFTVRSDETVALVGESGSGKSMTAKAIIGLLPPAVTATGTVRLASAEVDLGSGAAALDSLRGRHISLLLQNPFTSLSPVHRCGQQIAAALPRAQRTDDEIARRLDEVDLPIRVARQYPFELSGGMRQRVALAASLASDPEVLIGDEPTTALDVTTQREVLDLLHRIQTERGMALVLITHDLALARERGDRLLVMYAGRLMEAGRGTDLFERPQHPYTAVLRDSEPPLHHRVERLVSAPGAVPRPGDLVAGCPFSPRCPYADDVCHSQMPPLVGETAQVACWHPLSKDAAVTAAPAAVGSVTPSVADPLLVVHELSKRFSPSAPPALDAVSVTVGVGESVGIVGESGSGKTTLARCLVGLETTDSGTIEWASDVPQARRAQIVFQDPHSALNPAMTVGATLAEALRAGGRSRSDVPELLDMIGLPESYARRKPRGLSGGEQQRVAIARALAPDPQLLICDEAVSALDVSVQAQILNLLADLTQRLGLTLLFITHDLAVVRQVASRLYIMQRGQVVDSGYTESILANPSHSYTQSLLASVPGGQSAGAFGQEHRDA